MHFCCLFNILNVSFLRGTRRAAPPRRTPAPVPPTFPGLLAPLDPLYDLIILPTFARNQLVSGFIIIYPSPQGKPGPRGEKGEKGDPGEKVNDYLAVSRFAVKQRLHVAALWLREKEVLQESQDKKEVLALWAARDPEGWPRRARGCAFAPFTRSAKQCGICSCFDSTCCLALLLRVRLVPEERREIQDDLENRWVAQTFFFCLGN